MRANWPKSIQLCRYKNQRYTAPDAANVPGLFIFNLVWGQLDTA